MQQNPRAGGARGSVSIRQADAEHPKTNRSDPQLVSPVDLVAHRAPWAGRDELLLRRRLHRAGTIAQAQATREKNSTARELLWLVALTAGRWTFQRADDLATLKRILRALNQMFMAADNIRQEEGADDA